MRYPLPQLATPKFVGPLDSRVETKIFLTKESRQPKWTFPTCTITVDNGNTNSANDNAISPQNSYRKHNALSQNAPRPCQNFPPLYMCYSLIQAFEVLTYPQASHSKPQPPRRANHDLAKYCTYQAITNIIVITRIVQNGHYTNSSLGCSIISKTSIDQPIKSTKDPMSKPTLGQATTYPHLLKTSTLRSLSLQSLTSRSCLCWFYKLILSRI